MTLIPPTPPNAGQQSPHSQAIPNKPLALNPQRQKIPGPLRILVIDDSLSFCGRLDSLLTGFGRQNVVHAVINATVSITKNVKELVDSFVPDVILMDGNIVVHGHQTMQGPELIEFLRRGAFKGTILANSRTKTESMLTAGADYSVGKDMEQIRAAIKTLLVYKQQENSHSR
jgi:CheY-like chemotaxis protein